MSPTSTSRTRTRAAPCPNPNFEVVTYNSTATSSLKAFLRDTTAAVVAAQELHVLGVGTADLGTWADRNQWRSHIARALTGTGAGTRAGVGIFVWEGAAGSASVGIPVPGRAIAVDIDDCSTTPIVLYSLYLVTGGHLCDENLVILGTIGADARSRSLPFVIAGDFDVDPATCRFGRFPVSAPLSSHPSLLSALASARAVTLPASSIISWSAPASPPPLYPLAPSHAGLATPTDPSHSAS